jgi:hypothetical protein
MIQQIPLRRMVRMNKSPKAVRTTTGRGVPPDMTRQTANVIQKNPHAAEIMPLAPMNRRTNRTGSGGSLIARAVIPTDPP